MRLWSALGGAALAILLGFVVWRSGTDHRPELARETGAYEWPSKGFVYLQMWNEFTGDDQLVAFDESGEVRILYPDGRDRFTTGPAAAVQRPVESTVTVQRDAAGSVTAIEWRRNDAPPVLARRADTETQEEVQFGNGDVRLAGTLTSPRRRGRHPAIVLVHGSGAETRNYVLPYARFLVRHGMAVLGYDKRGAGQSTGEWKSASFEDLAGDVVAAVSYLKSRDDIDGSQIGLLGISQAGWIMPVAAVRTKDIAFLISVSGAGVSPAETTLDHAQLEMAASGVPAGDIAEIAALTRLRNEVARTGNGWAAYDRARRTLGARLGSAPDLFPSRQNHPDWDIIRRLYLFDPAPTLRQLRQPTLAIFGELDDNILPGKNRAAWDAALRAAANPDYTLTVLPRANHLQMEATRGTNEEIPSLGRFVPGYFTTVHGWLAQRVRGFGSPATGK